MKHMEYKGYLGTAEVDLETNSLFGKLFGIRDLVTYEAENPAELREQFHAAVDEYLADCESLGREPDRPCKGSFNVRVPPELHRELHLNAISRGMTLNEYVHITLRSHDTKGVNVTLVSGSRSHTYWRGWPAERRTQEKMPVVRTEHQDQKFSTMVVAVGQGRPH